MNARVTTVVVTRDRWPDLRRSLPHHESPVVLVDNASTDGTPERVAEEFPHVRVIRLDENLGAVARNVGVVRARTPYVAFADDDSWWAPGATDRAADLFEQHPALGLVTGRILLGVEEVVDPMSEEMARSPLPRRGDLPGPSVLGFAACAAVVRRDAFLSAGGFDGVVFFAGEEERLALDLAAAGWDLAYVEGLVVHHHPSPVRDAAGRRSLIVRNDLLTSIMRRPWPVVLSTAGQALVSDAAARRGVARGVSRAHLALRRRRVVPPAVERQRRLLG